MGGFTRHLEARGLTANWETGRVWRRECRSAGMRLRKGDMWSESLGRGNWRSQ
jgi:hypothetical protein